MLIEERKQIILKYLENHETVTTMELTKLTGASIATVRRDLTQLKNKGIIKKIHGGACLARPLENILVFDKKIDATFSKKETLAKLAAKNVVSGDILFLGAGVTCMLIARYIRHIENITIVTTNINAVLELSAAQNINILLLGGNINIGVNHIETLDEYTLQSLNKYYFDKAFITVDGIDLDYGYSIINRLQIPLYSYLLENSRLFYLVADSNKFDKRTFTHLFKINQVPTVITNYDVDKKYFDYFKNANIELITEK